MNRASGFLVWIALALLGAFAFGTIALAHGERVSALWIVIAPFGAFLIMVIILAVLALIVVKALTNSPWGTFTVAATIPIALFMGVYTRFIRPGRIGEVSIIGFVCLMLAITFGGRVAASP